MLGGIFHFYSNCNKIFCKQTVQILIRRRVLIGKQGTYGIFLYYIVLDFSLTIKAATLIFILGVVRLFHLLRKGNRVLFINIGK